MTYGPLASTLGALVVPTEIVSQGPRPTVGNPLASNEQMSRQIAGQLPSRLRPRPDWVVVELGSIADAGPDLYDAIAAELPTTVVYPNPKPGRELPIGTAVVLGRLAGQANVTTVGYDNIQQATQAVEDQLRAVYERQLSN